MNFLDVVDPYYQTPETSNELYIIIGVLSVLVIIFGIIAVIKNKKKKTE